MCSFKKRLAAARLKPSLATTHGLATCGFALAPPIRGPRHPYCRAEEESEAVRFWTNDALTMTVHAASRRGGALLGAWGNEHSNTAALEELCAAAPQDRLLLLKRRAMSMCVPATRTVQCHAQALSAAAVPAMPPTCQQDHKSTSPALSSGGVVQHTSLWARSASGQTNTLTQRTHQSPLLRGNMVALCSITLRTCVA
jgi:hypothetical protein